MAQVHLARLRVQNLNPDHATSKLGYYCLVSDSCHLGRSSNVLPGTSIIYSSLQVEHAKRSGWEKHWSTSLAEIRFATVDRTVDCSLRWTSSPLALKTPKHRLVEMAIGRVAHDHRWIERGACRPWKIEDRVVDGVMDRFFPNTLATIVSPFQGTISLYRARFDECLFSRFFFPALEPIPFSIDSRADARIDR